LYDKSAKNAQTFGDIGGQSVEHMAEMLLDELIFSSEIG
jgi:hypothetical protein